MRCASGYFHTLTLSDDGVVHSFGKNREGQLGLGDNYFNSDIQLPLSIRDFPRIKKIACGAYFSCCIDYEGILWTFGSNNRGQLGIGNTIQSHVPQKILKIPPVLTVACGYEHTLIITDDSNLWSCGYNYYGQLCLGNTEDQPTFQQTPFSNISKVSLGGYHSLFQNYEGDFFSCGNNSNGETAVGHFQSPQTLVTRIPNVPSNIIQFVCGHRQNLFLDSEGNVFSVGHNMYGQLGLGNNTNQNTLKQISNIPPIQIISCIGYSCYLLDFDGNVRSFGNNANGQLGLGDTNTRYVPTKIGYLKDIQNLSYGASGCTIFTKDSTNAIFVTGNNSYGQHGSGNNDATSIFNKIHKKYFKIWGDEIQTRSKSARK